MTYKTDDNIGDVPVRFYRTGQMRYELPDGHDDLVTDVLFNHDYSELAFVNPDGILIMFNRGDKGLWYDALDYMTPHYLWIRATN